MKIEKYNSNNLYGLAKVALFITSYMPLFFLIIVKQLTENYEYLHFGGLNQEALSCFLSKFSISCLLLLCTLFGICGCVILFNNLKTNVSNGYRVNVIDVNNRNGEAMGYIATYIIPFAFQGFNTGYEMFSIIFILMIVYCIYANSNMILINPILHLFRYSIFDIRYEYGGEQYSGLVIIKAPIIDENSDLKIYRIGFKLYFADNQ